MKKREELLKLLIIRAENVNTYFLTAKSHYCWFILIDLVFNILYITSANFSINYKFYILFIKRNKKIK